MRWMGLALLLLACGEGGAAERAGKRAESFALNDLSNPKSDGTATLLSERDATRLEQAFDAVIAAGERTVQQLEDEIARLEATNADKARQISELVQRIASRRAELERQYNNNLMLCMFFPDPSICMFANLVSNDGVMRDYEQQLAAARAEEARAQVDIRSYAARRDSLRAELEPIRASKARLVRLVRSDVALAPTPAVLGDFPAASGAYARAQALQQVASATRDEIEVLVAIRNAAAELSATLDASLVTLRGLATSVDELVQEARSDFMELLEAALGGDPMAAVDRWLDRGVARLTRQVLDGLEWPLSEFIGHLMDTHPAVEGVDADDLLAALADGEDPAGGDGENPEDPADPIEAPREIVAHSSDALGIYDLTEAVSLIRVTESMPVVEAELELHIEHTWRGDLKVWLEKDGAAVALLHDRLGGDADDLDLYRRVALAPTDSAGDWRLHVADEEALDEGRLVSWTLTLRTH